jgi:hypothetical protein
LKQFNPAVPDGLQQIVAWMLAKDPAKRYPTPERAAQALQVFLAAGGDPVASAEDDARMRSYLTWLEGGEPQPAAAPPLKAGAPAAPPRPAPPAKPPVKPAPAPEAKPPRGKRRTRPPEPPPEVEPVEEAEPVEPLGPSKFDVELVPTSPEKSSWLDRLPVRLTGRDFLMFGLGAATVLVAILLGWLVAVLVGRPR